MPGYREVSKLEDAVLVGGRNHGKCLLVRIGDKKYGFDIHNISNLIRVTTIVRVPKAQPQLKGIINLRGEIVAVTDIRPRQEFSEEEMTEDARIVILKLQESRKIGILVDQVFGMTEEAVDLFDIQAIACGSEYN